MKDQVGKTKEIEKMEQKYIPMGTSKIGGQPDLPKTHNWPVSLFDKRPLMFLAQINLKDLSHYHAIQGILPAEGWLFFFMDCLMQEGHLFLLQYVGEGNYGIDTCDHFLYYMMKWDDLESVKKVKDLPVTAPIISTTQA